jgi:hypothetical protein
MRGKESHDGARNHTDIGPPARLLVQAAGERLHRNRSWPRRSRHRGSVAGRRRLGAPKGTRAATVRERFQRNLLWRGSRAGGSELRREEEDERSKALLRRDGRAVRRSCGQAVTPMPGVRWRPGPPIDRSGRSRGMPTARASGRGSSSPAPSRAHAGSARGAPEGPEPDHPRGARSRRPRSARPAERNRPAVATSS